MRKCIFHQGRGTSRSLRAALPKIAISPGKAALLKAIGKTGSIAAAGRRVGISYRRAWLLSKTIDCCFLEPLPHLLFTPAAMVMAETVLVLPIVAAITRQGDRSFLAAILRSLYPGRCGAGPQRLFAALARAFQPADRSAGRPRRAAAEVGVVLIVGGDIAGATRTTTTAIALETSRGDFALALGLGVILLGLTLAINAIAHLIGGAAWRVAPT
jgi:hypothetical protein